MYMWQGKLYSIIMWYNELYFGMRINEFEYISNFNIIFIEGEMQRINTPNSLQYTVRNKADEVHE